MEAGRTVFDDTHFICDNDPLDSCEFLFGRPNWTASREHLTAQIEAARDPALSWMTYQEGISPGTTGACPVHSAGLYAAKHNPFVYFADVAGTPPDPSNAGCIAHTRELSQFGADMAAGKLANYVFVTPDLCHDMHGARGCGKNSVVGLAMHSVVKVPHAKQRKYINALVIAYLIEFEQLFAKAKRGCPNKTKKTY